MPDLITLAIPAFFALMGIELLVGRARGLRVFRGPDVVTNLSLGILQTLVVALAAALLVLGYAWVYAHHRVATISMTTWWAWPALFLGVDFLYYWFHRAAHRVNFLWATHAPHHSSEDYNLAVALRQGPVQPLASRAFYLPLAFVGFPLEAFAVMASFSTAC